MADIATVTGVAETNIAAVTARTVVAGDSVTNVLFPSAAAGIISSIQQVQITMLAANVTGAATITSVDTDRTVIFFTGIFGGKSQVSTVAGNDHVHVRVDFTSTVTVTATRNASDMELIIIATVVEYTDAAVDSVQRGTISYSGLSGTDTITSVNTARSVVLQCGLSTDSTGFANGSAMINTVLTNATTVTSSRGSNPGTNNIIVGYNVIEFATGIVDSVQQFDISIASGTTADATISSVDTARSCIFPGGFGTDETTTDMFDETCYGELLNATTVRATRQGSTNGTPTVAGTIVEFATGIIESIQRGVVTQASLSLTEDTTVTAVTTSQSVVIANGAGSSATQTIDPEEQHFTLEILDSTTIRSTKGVTGRNIIYPFELVEYAV